MYQAGLKYLATTQNTDGSWNDSRFGNAPGVVGLCVIAFLAHGDDPNYGVYSRNIKSGLDFILKSMNQENGYIGDSMYNHGFATLALAEAYGVVYDERIGPALKKAVDLILTAQANNPMGAWRYNPDSYNADTTVSGAVLVALFAAANAGIEVPEQAIVKALKFYVSCHNPDGGFGYTGADGGSNAPRSAIGTLVFALSRKRNSKIYGESLNYLRNAVCDGNNYYFYYLYYASQAFFQAGLNDWVIWNRQNIANLKKTQMPDGGWQGNHGRTFSTAAALLSLALNYRYLPIYER
jgi:hypothetical protein